MSFLKRALLQGIGQELGRAVGKAISNAVGPAQNAPSVPPQNAPYPTQPSPPAPPAAGGHPLAGLERTLQGYATQLSQHIKVCPACEKPASADQAFCPSCGARLPEATLAQGAVCPRCGRQNGLGMRFCQDCGTKLPLAQAEDEARAARDAQAIAEWDGRAPCIPRWCCGGRDFCFDSLEDGQHLFSARFGPGDGSPESAVAQYRQHLLQCGFRPAGMYPSVEHLYQRIDGVVYHVDTEHCFEGDPDVVTIGLLQGEPHGGFDYVKPEPKPATSWQDLFKR